jgi:hypothetical protein
MDTWLALVIAFGGLVTGAFLAYFFTAAKRASARSFAVIESEVKRLRDQVEIEKESLAQQAKAYVATQTAELGSYRAQLERERQLVAKEREQLSTQLRSTSQEKQLLESKRISLETFEKENRKLRQELLALHITTNALSVAEKNRLAEHEALTLRTNDLAARYLADTEKAVGSSISANNYAACKQRLIRVIEWCKEAGFHVPQERESELLSTLQSDFEKEVRKQLEREEQARIKQRLKEEQALEREVQKAIETAAREKAIVESALKKALSEAGAAHSAEVEELRKRLEEAEKANQRALSQAQLTKAGHIYVISNIGSFGEEVFKIGMTRRLDPIDRVDELSDASVPFPFDVHMLISCDDAPSLENALHKHFHKARVNRVNLKKEFFKLPLQQIHEFVEQHHGKVEYVASPEALEYRQSATMSDEDQEFIESTFARAEQGSVEAGED